MELSDSILSNEDDSSGLSGTLPSELGVLSDLQHLWLSWNALTGEIPSQLGALHNLWSLVLNGNRLVGPIPVQLGNLANLRSLWLNFNDLTGLVPSEVCSLPEVVSFSAPVDGSRCHVVRGYRQRSADALSGEYGECPTLTLAPCD